MRDINTGGNIYGGIHIQGQPDYIPYAQCDDEQLEAESVRLKAHLSRIRGARSRRLAFGYAITLIVIVASLWVLNTFDASLVGIIGVALGGITAYMTFQMWAEPKVDEMNLLYGLETVTQLRNYRRQDRPGR